MILASASPRRKEILSLITENFEVVTSDVDERSIEKEFFNQAEACSSDITKLSETLAVAKAKDVFMKLGMPTDTIVIGSDTSVIVDNEVLGKPKDHDDAVRMLIKLSGKVHSVVTGVALVHDKGTVSFSNNSFVTFNSYDEEQSRLILKYCDSMEPYDKAGAYGIQGKGALLINRIDGDFYSIMGLPVAQLQRELCKLIG
ncbi:MAG: Maf family protein [Clostridia bacterium]|nr:Maf family protein [Clostridia bacterium]